MPTAVPGRQSWSRAAIPALLVALPAVLFYGILFRCLVDLPIFDDCDALLGFLNQVVELKGPAAKFLYLLAAQHNEYKLFFAHGVAWAGLALGGRVNFSQLCMLGESAVLVLALILWRMFLPDEKDLARRLAFFVPVAWLLFQLGYWETLNWAVASLENLWVIVFSFAAIGCLLRPSRKSYANALVLYVLAVAASGNGFLLLPLGLLILAVRRRFVRAMVWLGVSAICIAAYAYRYNPMSSQSPRHGSVFSTLLHLRPDYVIAFVGNAGAIAGASPISVGISLTLGTALLLFFGWLAWRGYSPRNPHVSCCVLFLLLTAVGVAGLRSDFGLIQSVSSRYAIYGVLFLILAWTACAEKFVQYRSETLLNNDLYVVMAISAVVFALWMDGIGYKQLVGREVEVVKWMAAFERSGSPGSAESRIPPFEHPNTTTIAWRSQARKILNESIRLGVYEPPRF